MLNCCFFLLWKNQDPVIFPKLTLFNNTLFSLNITALVDSDICLLFKNDSDKNENHEIKISSVNPPGDVLLKNRLCRNWS